MCFVLWPNSEISCIGVCHVCSFSCLCVGNLPTILLILYPTRLFRKCVSCFCRWHALYMFVESLSQGQYKDRTSGTRDFMVVSASFLIFRILILGSFGDCHYAHISSTVQCILFGCALSFYAVVRPYKRNFSNNVDILILVLLETLSIANQNWAQFQKAQLTPYKTMHFPAHLHARELCPQIYSLSLPLPSYTHSRQHKIGRGLQARKVSFLQSDNCVMIPVFQDGYLPFQYTQTFKPIQASFAHTISQPLPFNELENNFF